MKPAALLDMRTLSPAKGARKSLYEKLKPGPGRSPEEVISNQLARLRGAMVELVAERGIGGVTVRGLASTAGVSTRTFYAHFPNAEECFTSTYESVMRNALQSLTAQEMTNDDWEAAVRSGLHSLTLEIAEHPPAAALALVEAFEAGPAMLREMSSKMREFERAVLETFAAAPQQFAMPRPIIQGIAAGVERVVRSHVLEGRGEELPELSEDLADWALSLHHSLVGGLAAPGGEGQGRERREVRRAAEREAGTSEFDCVGGDRGRILAATARLAVRDGYWNLSIPKIRREAAVSRKVFDEHFAGVDECFLGAVGELSEAAATRAERRTSGAEDWRRGVCRMVLSYCAEVARTPALAKLGFVDIFAPGRAGLRFREERISLGATILRRVAPPDEGPSQLAAEASAGAAWRIIQAEVAAGRAPALPQVAPQIAFVTLAPATGADRAVASILAELLRRKPGRRREAFIDERGLTQAAG